MKQKILAVFLSVCLLTELLPISVFADAAIGSCSHEHTDDCYEQVLDCSHEHTEDCYPTEADEEGTDMPPEEEAPSDCTHEHTDDCYRQVLACAHEHTPDCFAAAEDSQPSPEPGTLPPDEEDKKDEEAEDSASEEDKEDEEAEDPASPEDIPNTPEDTGDGELPSDKEEGISPSVHEHTPDCYQQAAVCLHEHMPECYPDADADESIPDTEGEDAVPAEPTEEPTQCTHTCTEENGCIVAVLSCPYAASAITGWSWVDEEILIQQGDRWYLALPGASEEQPATLEEIGALLPAELTVSLSDSEEVLPLKWDLSVLPQDGVWQGNYFLVPLLPDGYVLAEGTVQPQVLLLLGGAELQAAIYPARNFTPFASEADLEAELDNHVVQGLNPPATVVNLFDYASAYDGANKTIDLLPSSFAVASNNTIASTSGDWNWGINQGHLLLFGDMMIEAGYWNIGAGAGREWAQLHTNMQGIVKPLLEDGFPVLDLNKARDLLPDEKDGRDLFNLHLAENTSDNVADVDIQPGTAHALSPTVLYSAGADYDMDTDTWDYDNVEPSLDYLFNFDDIPSSNDGPGWRKPKRFYKNVTGLFQINDEGYYYYNARENFAQFVSDPTNTTRDGQPSAGYIKLYDGPAVWRTDGGWNPGSNSFDGEKSLGNFFPFNTAEEVFDGLETTKDGSSVLSSSEQLDNAKWSSSPLWYNRVPLKNAATNEDVYINHHMGMTVEIDFAQPVDGMLNMGSAGKQPMIFEFSGDDDVWIFIDDVLVLDIGGIHSELYGTIDFSTGDVVVGQSWRTQGEIPDNPSKDPNPSIKTTIKDQFFDALGAAAKDVSWNGNTFASSSTHTLKMFYLERGNYDSSLYLRFNLQEPLYHQVKKVNQNGVPLNDVEFELYAAKLRDGVTETSNDADDYELMDGTVLATLTTEENGTDTFVEEDDNGHPRPFNFADRYHQDGIQYYILRESSPPVGYRRLPKDIVLRFDPNTTMLVVANRYQTGAHSSFVSNIVEGGQITYGAFNTNTGEIEVSKREPSTDSERDGLVLAVPMQLQKNMNLATTTGKWGALYGNNLDGFDIIIPEERTAASWRNAVLKSMLYQCSGENCPSWYLEYDENDCRLKGILQDLPGQADQYELTGNPDFNMKMTYGIIEPYALEALGINEATSADRYAALSDYVRQQIEQALAASPAKPREEVVEQVISQISTELRTTPSPGETYDEDGDPTQRGFSFLNTNQFQREFRSLIYIPNEQRELQVWKIDEDGVPVNGAEFTLYEATLAGGGLVKGAPATKGITAPVDGRDGVLIFTPSPPQKPDGSAEPGYAKMEWIDVAGEDNSRYYILQETNTPAGYIRNDTEIPVVLGNYSIYADAGTADNGITVMAGVGKLMQTMIKYAVDGHVDVTLRDITAIAQTQPSLADAPWQIDGWEDNLLEDTGSLEIPRSMNLHYGVNALIDYGLHDEDGGKTMYPFFSTDTGFLSARVIQNSDVLENPRYQGCTNIANWEDLEDTDLTGLFRKVNIVVVTNKNTPEHHNGSLTISKSLTGAGLDKEDYTQSFTFTVELKDKNGNPLPKEYYYYGSDRSGYIADGETLILRHDESITILGLPPETRWKVTETADKGWFVNPQQGFLNGIIEADTADFAGFKNSREDSLDNTGDLVVRKVVTGSRGDTSRFFQFRVTLSDKTIKGIYGDMEFKDGIALFQLRHNESKTARSLPVGIRYTVEETNSAGHTVTSTGETGVIRNNSTAEAFFKNYRGGGGGGDKDYISITVKKVWALGNGKTPTDSVRAELLRDGQHYTSVTLNAANNWSHTWNLLDDSYHWTVAEMDVPEGFISKVTVNGWTWTITNSDTPKGDRPRRPGDPGNPGDPGDNPEGEPPKKPGGPGSPETGDFSQLQRRIFLCLGSLGVCVALLCLELKQKDRSA